LWVEQHCLTNTVPAARRVFALQESRPRTAFILEHRDGFTLKDVLRETGVTAGDVKVLRQINSIKDRRFEAADRTCEIQRLDVVLLGKPLD
jgi:hypothetical protein